ncbi:beta-L-arabinofuranosidase domain-containing protein [Bacteroides sp.]
MTNTSRKLVMGVALGLLSIGMKAQSYIPLMNETRMSIQPQVNIKAYPIPLTQVRLLDGPFKSAMEADRKWLLSLQPDRFLHRFHENAGFPTKGEIYEGWENSTQSGFCFGHYLSAMSMLYAATGDAEVLAKIEYSINELRKCQEARGTGYVDAIPGGEQLWNDVVKGNIDANTGWLNGIWVPWYNLHKLWAGLVDTYLYTGNEKAKAIVLELTDWACEKFKNLTDEQWQKMLYCETGGMNDALYNVYAISGKPEHLALAKKFYHKLVLDPLSQQKDQLAGLHANTQIPKIVGSARAYELGAEDKDHTIATFFWKVVRENRSYCIGGNSDHEHFEEPGKLSLSDKTTETCNTYNMLKLTRHLFAWEPEAKYMDFYERALYNHILASQNPETGMVVYYLPLGYDSFKDFSTPEHSFWCCVGTGFENHVKYAEGIYSENQDDLYVNLFIASELNWERRGMKIVQQTGFPDSDDTQLLISCPTPEELTFHIRYPEWATAGYQIKVNGDLQQFTETPGSYVSIKRTWKNGDKVEVKLPKSLHKEKLLGDEHKAAFLNGPLVLAGERNPQDKKIVLLEEANQSIDTWIQPIEGEEGTFSTKTGFPGNIDLIPFYKKYKGYYAIYFDCYQPDEWESVKDEYEKEAEAERELERLTLDTFRPNEQQDEIDHNFKGTNVARGDGALGKKWCDSSEGYFSFDMKVNSGLPAQLLLTYWGNDGGDRKFDILIDDELIATEELMADKPNEYYDRSYAIPFHLTQSKTSVVVKLRAYSGKKAGGLFFARMTLKKEMSDSEITVLDSFLPKGTDLTQHGFKSSGSRGTHKGHPWVDAAVNGELSFQMKSTDSEPMYLLLSYWGGEGEKRSFNVLAENSLLAFQELYLNKPEEMYDVLYEIPEHLTVGKDRITISLKGVNSKAGGLFYAYTLSKAKTVGMQSVKEEKDFPFIVISDGTGIIFRNPGQALSGELEIYNSGGQLMYNRSVKIDKEWVLNEKLSKGAYVLRFSLNGDTAWTMKVVV